MMLMFLFSMCFVLFSNTNCFSDPRMEQDLEEEEEEEGTVRTVMGRGVRPTFSNEKEAHHPHLAIQVLFGKRKNKVVSALWPLVVLISGVVKIPIKLCVNVVVVEQPQNSKMQRTIDKNGNKMSQNRDRIFCIFDRRHFVRSRLE